MNLLEIRPTFGKSIQDHGGNIPFNVIGKMRELVPSAKLYAWHERMAPFADRRIHTKIIIASGNNRNFSVTKF